MTKNSLSISLSNKSQNETTLISFSALEKTAKILNKDLQKVLETAVSEGSIKASHLETVGFRELKFQGYRNVVVIGAGDLKKLDEDKVRQLGAATYDILSKIKNQTAAVEFSQIASNKKDHSAYVKAFTEGFYLASYRFDELKSKKSDAVNLQVHLLTKFHDAASKKAVEEGATLADGVNFARYLGDMPANLLTPDIFTKKVLEKIKGTKIKATVWDKARIKKEKMGGLLGVSMGSSEEPRFLILELKNAPASKKPIVYVGKGLTFDCGGISIKPSAGMEEMKYDMCGGANVVGSFITIAKLGIKVNAYAIVALTENMPGPSATKPGDIHTARNGKTFEINNTDAEGRLVLADALTYASELKPQVIFDAATLTGAMAVALGNTHTGYFTRSKELRKRIDAAAEAAGEWVWNMPLTDFHLQDMKGTYADLSNISSGKGAGSATAAAFLEQFVAEGIPWAHFDIAGTAWHTGSRWNYNPKKGASGVMIRTFVELAKSY